MVLAISFTFSDIDEKCIDQVTRAQDVSSKICENNILFSSVQKCKTLDDLCTVIIMEANTVYCMDIDCLFWLVLCHFCSK